jgi:hypothetical protein
MLNTSKNVNEQFYIALYSLLNAGYSSSSSSSSSWFCLGSTSSFHAAIVLRLHLTNKGKVPVLN